jgi:hypothetical protein
MSVRLQRLIRENADSVAASIVLEQGKTLQGQINHGLDFFYPPGICIQMRMATSRADFKLRSMLLVHPLSCWARKSKVRFPAVTSSRR